MRLEFAPRADAGRLARLLTPVAATLAALLVAGLLLALSGRSALQAFRVYFVEPLSDAWGLQEVAVKAVPLLLIALGLSFCFRAKLWNIGAEGQYVMGALAGCALGLFAPAGWSPWLLLPAMLLLGMLGGVLWASVPALLRARLGVSEILSSLMLVYLAELVLDYVVRGPWRDPAGFNFPHTALLPDAATLPMLVEGGRLHAGLPLALAALVVSGLVQRRALFGFALTLAGEAPRAARFAGFSDARLTLAAFAISGGLAGLAGVVEVAGQIGQLKPSISPGYGFTAITVAFLGRLDPVGILLASFALALTFVGAEAAQITLKLPLDATRAFQGLLLLCVLGADALVTHRLRVVPSRRTATA